MVGNQTVNIILLHLYLYSSVFKVSNQNIKLYTVLSDKNDKICDILKRKKNVFIRQINTLYYMYIFEASYLIHQFKIT